MSTIAVAVLALGVAGISLFSSPKPPIVSASLAAYGPNPTVTTVACALPVATGQTITCTAVVVGTILLTTFPTGTVTFASANGGTFPGAGGATCTLNMVALVISTCSVSFKAPSTPVTVETITAHYSGDGNYAPSNGQVSGAVVSTGPSKHTSATVVACLPALLNPTATCTATVTGVALAAAPTGTVHWSSALGATLTPNPCILTTLVADVATCTSNYTTGKPLDSVVGLYSGDALYNASYGLLQGLNL